MDTTSTKYTRMLRRMRQRIFDYPPAQATKADRVLLAIKARALREQEPARLRAEYERSERMLRLWA